MLPLALGAHRLGTRAALERDPDCSGSLGLAISEAVEMALQHPEDTRYCLGSVLNHVLLHQTVIGQEAVAQMEMADAEPDVVIGCFGGGSNFAGLSFPFLRKKLVEANRCASWPSSPPAVRSSRAARSSTTSAMWRDSPPDSDVHPGT